MKLNAHKEVNGLYVTPNSDFEHVAVTDPENKVHLFTTEILDSSVYEDEYVLNCLSRTPSYDGPEPEEFEVYSIDHETLQEVAEGVLDESFEMSRTRTSEVQVVQDGGHVIEDLEHYLPVRDPVNLEKKMRILDHKEAP